MSFDSQHNLINLDSEEVRVILECLTVSAHFSQHPPDDRRGFRISYRVWGGAIQQDIGRPSTAANYAMLFAS